MGTFFIIIFSWQGLRVEGYLKGLQFLEGVGIKIFPSSIFININGLTLFE